MVEAVEVADGVDRQRARCAGGDVVPSLFFSDRIPEIAEAKAICGGCTQVRPCLDGALARREACGVWGGELFVDGKVVAHKRPRGRPRKHPLPVPA